MLKLIFSILVILLFSCSENEIATLLPSSELDGKYSWRSTVSSIPVDINLDGNYTVSLMEEANVLKDTAEYFLELKTQTLESNQKAFYVQELSLWTPLPIVVKESDGKYLYTVHGVQNILAQYKHYKGDLQIKIFGSISGGNIVSAKRTASNMIEVTYNQFFYTANGWEELLLTSVYERME